MTNKEGILTMLASEKVLKKEWDNKLDERWNNVLAKRFTINKEFYHKFLEELNKYLKN